MEEREFNINFGKLFSYLWNKKFVIFGGALLTAFIAAGISLMMRDEFISKGKILPELQGKGAGNLSQFAGLASLAGIDLNSMGAGNVDAVRPDLYPDVINSTPFYLDLLKLKVTSVSGSLMSVEEYVHTVLEKGKEPTEKLLKKYASKDSNIIVINRLTELRILALRDRIGASLDKKSGVISINCKMPDPLVSAQITKFAMIYLMDYVKKYRTEKLRNDVRYLENQVELSRAKYYTNQSKRANYLDQFKDMQLQSADLNRERLQANYNLSATFYNELLKKLEEAKFKLHQETPVFKVLEPASAPAKKSEPKRAVIVFVSFILGLLLTSTLLLFRNKAYKLYIYYS
jgi:uncharacterized protein involved in exopolysaccharide biosynthesis